MLHSLFKKLDVPNCFLFSYGKININNNMIHIGLFYSTLGIRYIDEKVTICYFLDLRNPGVKKTNLMFFR